MPLTMEFTTRKISASVVEVSVANNFAVPRVSVRNCSEINVQARESENRAERMQILRNI